MVKKQVKRGVFNGKKAQYQLSLMLPKPHTFARLTTIPLALRVSRLCSTRTGPDPFHSQITSSDPSVTGLFPLSSIAGQLVQRTHVTALGVTNIHDSKVGAPVFAVDGPNEGVSLPAAKGGQPGDQLEAVWEKRFTGSVQLVSSIGRLADEPLNSNTPIRLAMSGPASRRPTSRSNTSSWQGQRKVVLSALLRLTAQRCHYRCDGVGNDAELACSVEIVSSAPGPTAVRSSPNGTNGAPPPPPDDNLGLPPSYFEAVVDGNEKS